MTDLVEYELPFGLLGNIAHAITAKKKLRQIFTYRYYKINELFGDWLGSELDLVFDQA
jgi:ligand-binding SRPBCC domain-containing protein